VNGTRSRAMNWTPSHLSSPGPPCGFQVWMRLGCLPNHAVTQPWMNLLPPSEPVSQRWCRGL
jgi:hypothetical protein